jgi:hypothetical protein
VANRAKRRRRERKREKRATTPRTTTPLIPAGGGKLGRPERPRLGPLTDDSPGDALSIDLPRDDEQDGSAPVRQPNPTKPTPPLAGAAAAEPPVEAGGSADAVAESSGDPEAYPRLQG